MIPIPIEKNDDAILHKSHSSGFWPNVVARF